MNITANCLIERNPEMVFTELDGKTVVMSVENGAYYGMDSVGGAIWALLAQSRTLDDLCDLLSQEYDADKSIIMNDVIPYVRQLIDERVVLIRK